MADTKSFMAQHELPAPTPHASERLNRRPSPALVRPSTRTLLATRHGPWRSASRRCYLASSASERSSSVSWLSRSHLSLGVELSENTGVPEHRAAEPASSDDFDDEELSALLLHEVERSTDEHDGSSKSLGEQRLEELSFSLLFPEPNAIRMIYVAELKMRVAARTRFIERRFAWTGNGVKGRPTISAFADDRRLNAVQHGPAWVERGSDAFLIDLGETLDKGTELAVEISQPLVDEVGTFRPHLAHYVAHDYTKLSLRVEFAYAPESCEVFVEAVDPVSHERTIIQKARPLEAELVDGQTRFSYLPRTPVKGRHVLEWR